MKRLATLSRFAAAAAAALTGASAANAALIAYWPLNDGPAGSVVTGAAEVIDGNAGVHKNGVVSQSGTGALGNDTWVFDATLDRIVLSTTENNRLNLGTQGIQPGAGFTWSLWVNTTDSSTLGQFPNDDSGANTILGNRQGGNTYWKLEPNILTGPSGNYAVVDFSPDLPDGSWHHVVVRGTGTAVSVFIDGILKGTDTTLGTAPDTAPLFLGGNPSFSGEDLTGLLSDVAIWDEGLTNDEAKGLYDVGINSSLGLYTAGDFNLLKNIHDAGTGFVEIDNLRWTFASGLTGPAGLTGSGTNFTLVLNATGDTGLSGQLAVLPIPEPATATLALLGLGSMMMRRRRMA